MYEDVEDEMVDAGVARKRDIPVWVDREGNLTNQDSAYGLKSQTELLKPDCCLVFDEVGSSTSMMKDGHMGGKKYVCAVDDQVKEVSTNSARHFTTIGLTALDGNPVICVVIVQGKKRDILVEAGIDLEYIIDDDNDDIQYAINDNELSVEEFNKLLKHLGANNKHPGGPTCKFRGKDIPCMVRFTDSGSVTGNILIDMLKTLDKLEVFSDIR